MFRISEAPKDGEMSLRKHTFLNILRILPPKKKKKKKKKNSEKNSGSFHISAQNIDCGFLLEPLLRGGSNEYTESLIL